MAERTMQLTLTTCRQHQGCDQPICPEAFSFGYRQVSEAFDKRLVVAHQLVTWTQTGLRSLSFVHTADQSLGA